MIRYYFFAILLFIGFNSCNTNRPQQAAKEYCECLEHQYDNNIDTMTAFEKCDSQIAIHYKELSSFYDIKYNNDNVSDSEFESRVKFENEFSRQKLRNCCNLIGNCDTLHIDFTDSLRNYFSTYILKKNVKYMVINDILLQYCIHENINNRYKISENAELLALNENGVTTSTFYYEIDEFADSKEVDKLIYSIYNDSCVSNPTLRIMSYKRIDQKTILLCNYSKFDFEKMKRVINRTFGGDSLVQISK